MINSTVHCERRGCTRWCYHDPETEDRLPEGWVGVGVKPGEEKHYCSRTHAAQDLLGAPVDAESLPPAIAPPRQYLVTQAFAVLAHGPGEALERVPAMLMGPPESAWVRSLTRRASYAGSAGDTTAPDRLWDRLTLPRSEPKWDA